MPQTSAVEPGLTSSAVRRSVSVRAWSVIAALVVIGLALINLTTFPRTWFDEGSHLHVPKTLVTRGVYADYSSEGYRYFGPSIGIGPTVMLPVAAAFKLFGVGLLPARLVIVAYLFVAIVACFALARSFGGVRLAWLAASILVGSQAINLLELGRQVLGEVPSLAFLALGWAAWLEAEAGADARRLLLAGALFGLSAITKNQAAILLIPMLLVAWLANLVYYRRRLPQRYFLIPLVATVVAYAGWQAVVLAFLGPGTFAQNLEMFRQVTSGAALVFSPSLMVRSVSLLLSFDVFAGWIAPVLIYGLIIALRRTPDGQRWGHVMIFILGGLVWYVFASISWLRYAFLPLSLAALVAAQLIDDLLTRFAPPLRQPRERSEWWASLQRGESRAAIALAIAGAFALMSVAPLGLTAAKIVNPPAPDPQRLAEYLNNEVPRDALIETWEPELGFLTDHNYHFPPQSLLDVAVRHVWLDGPSPARQYDFDALAPDYVAVGEFAKYVHLYPPEQLAADFRLLTTIGVYDVYIRIE
jgi:4-amino-4-deoxy-L-arabinose transferase-like glycosyltransferase